MKNSKWSQRNFLSVENSHLRFYRILLSKNLKEKLLAIQSFI